MNTEASFPRRHRPGADGSRRPRQGSSMERHRARKGTDGVSTNVTANSMFLDRGTFWVINFYLPKSARAYLFPNLSKFITFAAASLVLTPLVRNQRAPRVCAVERGGGASIFKASQLSYCTGDSPHRDSSRQTLRAGCRTPPPCGLGLASSRSRSILDVIDYGKWA